MNGVYCFCTFETFFFCIFFFIYIYINWSICSVDDGF